jgi:hypothetical protein
LDSRSELELQLTMHRPDAVEALIEKLEAHWCAMDFDFKVIMNVKW